MEAPMWDRKRYGPVGLLLAVLILSGMASGLSACNTVAGAGQDVSTIGRGVTSGAEQTKKATGIP
jgi:predicted small secreted protein